MTQDKGISQEAMQAFKVALSEFTYSDFVEGDEPYTLLAEVATAPEVKARFEQLFEKRAQQCGVPIRMVRTIMKTKSQSMRTAEPSHGDGEKVFAFDGQPIALRAGKYVADGDRICIEDRNGLEVICPHPIIPSKRYVDIETGAEALEISFRREYWKRLDVERGRLASATTIIQLANQGISVTSENSRQMVKYLSYIDDLNRDIIPTEKTSSHLGWIESGFVPYVDGVSYTGEGTFSQMYRSVKEKGSYKKWLEAIKGIRAAGCIQARLVMAASFASVLLTKFDALPFFVHLWSARSGTGKTVALETAASVWADPQVGAFCRPMKATTVGLEQLAVFTCNLPLCLDELQTMQGRGGFDDIVYMLCEGNGKTRGARNGGLRNSPSWKNCIITTGEMPIIGSCSKAGAVNRVIELECKGKVMPDAKSVHRAITANYGFAGRRFIKAIMDPKVMRAIEKDQQEIFDRLAEVGTDKQVLSASILLAADHAAEKLIFQDGIRLTEADILPFIKNDLEVDSGRRAHEFLLEWIAENRTGFVTSTAAEITRTRNIYGYVELDNTGKAKSIWVIGKSFDEVMTEGGFSPASYLSWAQGEGLIRCDGANKKVVKWIPGMGIHTRCVCLVMDGKPEEKAPEMATVLDADLPW